MTRVREAATLMLVDDRPDLHVFMLRRNPRSVFGPGAFVFPGGAVDSADSDADVTNRVIGLDDARASARLGLPSGGLRIWIAAAREAFEEAGILLAVPETGAETLADALVDARMRLNSGELRFAEVLAGLDLRLELSEVFLFSHWLTPEGAPRRYDTWFLVAPAPSGQEGSHDDAELVHSEWVRPSDALARYASGDLDLIFPTLRTLRVIESFETAAALLDALRDTDRAPDRSPLVVADASGQRVALAGDDPGSAVPGWRSLPSRRDANAEAFFAERQHGQREGVA